MLVPAVVPSVFPRPFPSRDGTVDKVTDPCSPAQFLEILTLCCCNLQEDVWKIANAAQPSAVAEAGWTALKPGQCAGSCNAICPWQQRSLTLFLKLQSSLTPSTSHLVCDSHEDSGFVVPPTCHSIFPSLPYTFSVHFPSLCPCTCFLSLCYFSLSHWSCQTCPSSQDSELKLFLCWKVIMAARNQLWGPLWTEKQMEAETGLIMKQGLQNPWRCWPEVPRLFPETNGCIFWMLAGDTGTGDSSSCGHLSSPGYGVLHVMPPHLTNTHDCCCQAALDKENVLTAVAAEEISWLVPRATFLQSTGSLKLLS